MTGRTNHLPDALYTYMVEHSVRESDVLRRLRAETATLESSNMQIGPEQGQFMALLVELIGAENALEIGTFTGYSTLVVAAALPEHGRLVACDISEEWTSIARRYWEEAGVDHKIDLRLAPASETLDALLAEVGEGHFDFAFIDADKEGYDAYYESALRLVRTGGLIAIDNTLWEGKVVDPSVTDADTQAIRRLNSKLATDDRISLSLLPIGDGLSLARVR
ncbi:MAG: class I SAM-dependent methyltransferase [Gemmatimonadetes bacterium]|nr:class I SAM-dependent methyltransferase [Gemmatimonadota bacterium]